MNYETDESIWQRLSKTLFGIRKTTDERLFTARVMAEIRQRQPADRSWRLFIRWSVPILGMAVASLVLALRVPDLSAFPSTDTLLFQSQTIDEDFTLAALGESQ